MTVTSWQSCQPAVAQLYAYQCLLVQTVDLSWHRGLPGWVTGSDIHSASDSSVPVLLWQLPASHTATVAPWLPPHLDLTPEKGDGERQRERDVTDIALFFSDYEMHIKIGHIWHYWNKYLKLLLPIRLLAIGKLLSFFHFYTVLTFVGFL